MFINKKEVHVNFFETMEECKNILSLFSSVLLAHYMMKEWRVGELWQTLVPSKLIASRNCFKFCLEADSHGLSFQVDFCF